MVEELKFRRNSENQATIPTTAPMVGWVIGSLDDGYLQVKSDSGQILRTRMVADLAGKKRHQLLGQEVVLLFADNDPQKPIAMASLQPTGDFASALQAASRDEHVEATIDGEKVLIQAKQKLELRVGKASIVIDANGKITIQGAHLLSRSTGPIRIKGGHVDIN